MTVPKDTQMTLATEAIGASLPGKRSSSRGGPRVGGRAPAFTPAPPLSGTGPVRYDGGSW